MRTIILASAAALLIGAASHPTFVVVSRQRRT
jgi:hypothetical protein